MRRCRRRRRRDALAAQTETGNEQRQGEGVFVTGGGYLWIDARSPLSTFPANLWRRRDGHISEWEHLPRCLAAPSKTLQLKAPIISFLRHREMFHLTSNRGRERERDGGNVPFAVKVLERIEGEKGKRELFSALRREGGSGKTSGRHRAGGHNKWVARSLSLCTWINSESR